MRKEQSAAEVYGGRARATAHTPEDSNNQAEYKELGARLGEDQCSEGGRTDRADERSCNQDHFGCHSNREFRDDRRQNECDDLVDGED